MFNRRTETIICNYNYIKHARRRIRSFASPWVIILADCWFSFSFRLSLHFVQKCQQHYGLGRWTFNWPVSLLPVDSISCNRHLPTWEIMNWNDHRISHNLFWLPSCGDLRVIQFLHLRILHLGCKRVTLAGICRAHKRTNERRKSNVYFLFVALKKSWWSNCRCLFLL